jgi:hypothetical protein
VAPAKLGSSTTQERGLPNLRSADRSAFVDDDLEQPRPEGPSDLEPPESPKGFDERELGDFVRIVWPRDKRRDSLGHALVSLDEESVRVGIAGLRAADQRDVVG